MELHAFMRKGSAVNVTDDFCKRTKSTSYCLEALYIVKILH